MLSQEVAERRGHTGGVEQRLSLVTLGVRDLARARAFYEALGWSGESPGEDIVFFQAGGIIISLWDRAALAEDSASQDGGAWGGVTIAHNVDSPDAVDAVLEEARLAGATIARAGAPTFWGGYSGVFVDPEGHPWEIAHNPGWRLAADGSIHLH
jgi:catechol 2,3-dioxygenase-like lactoylglutathione lyase family enzyme